MGRLRQRQGDGKVGPDGKFPSPHRGEDYRQFWNGPGPSKFSWHYATPPDLSSTRFERLRQDRMRRCEANTGSNVKANPQLKKILELIYRLSFCPIQEECVEDWLAGGSEVRHAQSSVWERCFARALAFVQRVGKQDHPAIDPGRKDVVVRRRQHSLVGIPPAYLTSNRSASNPCLIARASIPLPSRGLWPSSLTATGSPGARTNRAPRRPSCEQTPAPSARIRSVPAISGICEYARPETASGRPPKQSSASCCRSRPCRHRLSRRRSPPVCRSRPRPGIRRIERATLPASPLPASPLSLKIPARLLISATPGHSPSRTASDRTSRTATSSWRMPRQAFRSALSMISPHAVPRHHVTAHRSRRTSPGAASSSARTPPRCSSHVPILPSHP